MLRVEKRYAHGFNLSATYTWSKFLDNSNDPGTTSGADSGAYLNYYNRRRTTAIRPMISTSGSPSAPSTNCPSAPENTGYSDGMSHLVGGWSLSNVTVVQSGAPLTVVTQTDSTHAFSAGTQRADVLHNPNLPSGQRSVRSGSM